jgi:uncharacterized Zn finger protein
VIVPGLSESTLRDHASAESVRRGEVYAREGAVRAVRLRENQLQADVQGSEVEPYRVEVTLDEAGIRQARCSCPYTWAGWCKHIVAVLLTVLREPEQVVVRPPLEELLVKLDAAQLRELLLALAAGEPALVEAIEAQLGQMCQAAPQGGSARAWRSTEAASERRAAPQGGSATAWHAPVDTTSLRREVAGALHSLDRMRRSEAYWQVGSVVGEVERLLDRARAYVEAGDGANALAVLEAITEEYVAGWTALDDSDGIASGFFRTLGRVWTEAALVTELSRGERRAWAQRLTGWQGEADLYGVEDAFDAAQVAFIQGWDHPPLQRILEGRGGPLWEGEPPWYAETLTEARLAVLEEQGRHEAYLRLARAAGQAARYVLMLARLGRVEEAAEAGMASLEEPAEVLALAQALREAGALEAALRVGEHGLSLSGYRAGLARWLCELAVGLGREELALRAAAIAFQSDPRLDAYLRVQDLAGARWPALREALLAGLRRDGWGAGRVEVYLHEGLIDDAIAVVEEQGGYTLLEQVMDAALEERPEWVIEAAQAQAARIIEPGRAKYYHHAVSWLERARAAYRAAGREAEWQAYLSDLRARHGRKYKLMRMIEGM